MYLTRPTRLTKACAALGLAVAVSLLVAPKPACAGDDDSAFYKATLGRVLESIGLKSADDTSEIHYRERPPLVIPPGHDLPPPEKADAVANPAWPKDPDVRRRKLLEKQAKDRPDRETERLRSEDPKLMTPDALAPGPRPRGVKNVDTEGPSALGKLLSPSELGHKSGLFGNIFRGKDDDVAKFTGEPARTSLTEPPPGYQTPSPDQPYGTGKAPPPALEDDYLHRGEMKSGN
jgi:hypothetical protein